MATQLRLMTYNIAHGRGLSLYQGFQGERRLRKNLKQIAGIIEQNNIDIAALQEVDQDSHWNKSLDQLHIIKDECTMKHALYGINNRREGEKHLNYGNGILSRHPIHLWKNNPFGEAPLGEKGFLYAEVDVAGHHLPIINLHLDYKSRSKRIQQIEKVIAFITDNPDPNGHSERLAPIICGDFNSRSKPVGDAVSHLFKFVQSHGHYKLYPERARTFPAHLPSKGIDFVLLPAPYRYTSHKVIRSFASDHLPVVIEFELD